MSIVINKGVNIHLKAVMYQMFTVVGLLVELSIPIAKPKGSHE